MNATLSFRFLLASLTLVAALLCHTSGAAANTRSSVGARPFVADWALSMPSQPALPYLLAPRFFNPQRRLVKPAADSSTVNPWPESDLHAFIGTDGNEPDSLVADAAGHLFGTTFGGGRACGCGTVFELIPPVAGHVGWTQRTVYAFAGGTDGIAPDSALIVDGHGNLYGTTFAGGSGGVCLQGCGTVFRLAPPTSNSATWTETILHSFTGLSGDGVWPYFSNLVAINGALYGTTANGGQFGGGTAYKLAPPAPGQTAWNITILHSFPTSGAAGDGSVPKAALVASGGSLYSTTTVGGGTGCGGTGCGTVFKLTPPATAGNIWTESLIHVFHGSDGNAPAMGLIVDKAGDLFSITEYGGKAGCSASLGCGTVFKLVPPGPGQTGWTHTVVHYFNGADGYLPFSGLLGDAHGNIYGSTQFGGAGNAGTIFKITPPGTGQITWTASMLHAFTGGADGAYPGGNLIQDAGGAIYGTNAGGAASTQYGTVFELH